MKQLTFADSLTYISGLTLKETRPFYSSQEKETGNSRETNLNVMIYTKRVTLIVPWNFAAPRRQKTVTDEKVWSVKVERWGDCNLKMNAWRKYE